MTKTLEVSDNELLSRSTEPSTFFPFLPVPPYFDRTTSDKINLPIFWC